jgi:hypothetical protein
VVRGVSSGWKTSVEKVTSGGKMGYVDGKEIWKRRTAAAYGPVRREYSAVRAWRVDTACD